MSQKVKGFYHVTQMIYDFFRAQEGVGLIEIGLRPSLDENKRSVGTLILIAPGAVSIEEKYSYFNLTIFAVDYVDQTNRDVREMPDFQGISNMQDVLHETNRYLTNFVNSLQRGDLNIENWDVRLGTANVIIDEMPNLIAGWGLDIQIGAFHGGVIC